MGCVFIFMEVITWIYMLKLKYDLKQKNQILDKLAKSKQDGEKLNIFASKLDTISYIAISSIMFMFGVICF